MDTSDNNTREIITAELVMTKAPFSIHSPVNPPEESVNTDAELARVNQELERYTNHADKKDYALAIASGLLAGAIDSFFIGSIEISDKKSIKMSHESVNRFIEKYADERGLKGKHLKDTIANLEEHFPVAQDNVWKGKDIKVSAQNHHLADLAHHPTPLGLMAAIAVRFFGVGVFVNREGEIHLIPVKTDPEELVTLITAAIITGLLNWLVDIIPMVLESKDESDENRQIPEAIIKLARLAASIPVLVEIAKCADNWFGHLVSDMGGSKNTPGKGMGIPGVFLSLLYEFSALPVIKDTGLPAVLNDLYQNQKFNLRKEIPLYKAAGKLAMPVLFNEVFVRGCYFVSNLVHEISQKHGLKGIEWNSVVPFGNRTIDRMMTVATLTFSTADTADAAVRAAIESRGNWVLFAGRFVSRYNYVGGGRAVLAIYKEISNEKREAELIHEKMQLSEAKAAIAWNRLIAFEEGLEERVCTYLAEDIEAFMEGFDLMQRGMDTGDANLFIRGNVTIQRILGKEPQFTNQEEFDDLMESDIPLQL